MLKVQEFIHNHPDDWDERLSNAPYFLKISNEGDFFIFKYSQIKSDFSKEICREARGIILDSANDWKVVRLAFFKFFNYGEQYADSLDWEYATATEKIDGSLMSLWHANGEWHLSTNGTIDAYKAELVGAIGNFGKLFDIAAKNSNLDYSKLNPQYCYTFELVSPYNRVVISYPQPALYHILTRDMETLVEVEEDIGVQKPKEYSFSAGKDFYFKAVEEMDETHEGIVVKDNHNHRVKIKTPLYFELHKTINNGCVTIEKAIDLIRANDYEEFLVYFPEYKEFFKTIAIQINNFDLLCKMTYENADAWLQEQTNYYGISLSNDENDAAGIEIRKKFRPLYAQWVKDYYPSNWAFLAFSAYDGYDHFENQLNKISPKKINELMDIQQKIEEKENKDGNS